MDGMRYETPATVDAAVALLAEAGDGGRVLAGGTDLIVQMRYEMVTPDVIVDIKKIDETRTITEEDGGYRLGAAIAGSEMGEHDGLKKMWPGVVEATELIGSTQVQGRASPGGNLCNASPAADSVPALVAAYATARIAGPNGVRDVPVEEIPVSPGKTSLQKGEFIVSIFLPKRPDHAGDAYLRFIPRTEMDIAVVGVGVSLVKDSGGTITEARVSLGAVAPTVLIVDDAAKAIIGTKLEDGAMAKLAAAASAACKPIDDKRGTIEFRTKVAGVLARRVAQIAYDRAG